MGSWKQSSQICGQQPCKTKRASKGQSVSEAFAITDNYLLLPIIWHILVFKIKNNECICMYLEIPGTSHTTVYQTPFNEAICLNLYISNLYPVA